MGGGIVVASDIEYDIASREDHRISSSDESGSGVGGEESEQVHRERFVSVKSSRVSS